MCITLLVGAEAEILLKNIAMSTCTTDMGVKSEHIDLLVLINTLLKN